MKLFFDTETTGMFDFKASPTASHQPHIVQIGALLTDDLGNDKASIDLIIKPDGWTISPEVAAIHGITTEIAEACGVPLIVALSAFTNLARCADMLIAHNLAFDSKILTAAFVRLQRESFHQTLKQHCTMEQATPICRIPAKWGSKFKWPKLIEAHQHLLGVGFEGAHSAMVDVLACKRIFFAMNPPTLI